MSLRCLASASLVATVIAAVPISLAAQAPKPAASASKPLPQADTPPRTPWGDPDLQGNYTNVYENGTPLERPDQFAGRTLDEVRGEELAAIKKATQERTINNFQGPIHAPDHWWQDALFLEKGSQAWFVTDPTDGKIPPVTAEAQRRSTRRAPRGPRAGAVPPIPSRIAVCTTAASRGGCPGSMMPAIYGNSYRIVQGQGFVAITYEMIHETRVIPIETQPRPHVGKKVTWTWATPAATGKATRSSSRPRTSTRAASTGTPIPTRCGWSSASPASRPTR